MGMRIRRIQTERKVINGKTVVVPVLDDQGQEIELFSVDVPQEIETRLPQDLDYSSQASIEEGIAAARRQLEAELTQDQEG